MDAAKHEHAVNSDGASSPEATRLASGADAPPDDGASVAPPATDAGPDPTDEQQEPDAATLEVSEDDDHQGELDLEQLAARAEKADAYLELAQRTKADFENYRKRATREVAAAQERGMTKLARELLPAIDNLERALAAAEAEGGTDDGAEHTLAAGIKLVQAELVTALARAGIEPFTPLGDQFDPQRHEAVAQQPIEGAEAGTIVEVYQRGYTLGELVLRPARVVVAG